MRPTRTHLALVSLVAAGLSGPAQAQNFFEELFGIGRAARPPVPPRGVPSAPIAPQSPAPVPGDPIDPGLPGDPSAEAPRPAPQPARPVVLKAPADESVLGQDLALNGLTGSLRLERAGAGMTARVKLPGTKVSQPTEVCSVPLSGDTPLTLTTEGRPDGLARYEAAATACPLRFEILDGSVLVTPLGTGPICTFTAADCATTPAGLWGPAAASLIPRSAEFDTARGIADKAVRDNYKVMTQRARREDVRPIVTEQAAFSSDREQVCRTYAREGAHGFCHLRFTEGRALALATRLGVTPGAAPTAAAAPPRPARRKPPVDGMNPEAGGLPPIVD